MPLRDREGDMSGLVFHRRRSKSGEIRASQVAAYLGAPCNPEHWEEGDTHVWVKMQPPEDYPPRSYLDIIDAKERVPWLAGHPEIGVIASSVTGKIYLQNELGRDDIFFIPQHHCNYEREVRQRDGVKVAGVVGGCGAIQCDVEDLKERLARMGIEFRWQQRFGTREEVVDFYCDLDVQITWRLQDRPLKNPLKIVNAASFGIPTVCHPEMSFQEMEDYYTPVKTLDELQEVVRALQQNGWDAERLISKAEEYHIDNVAPLYKGLLV